MRTLSLLLFLVALRVPSAVLGDMVQPEQIAKTVFLNDTTFVAYNSSSNKCRIDCADGDIMLHKDFRSFQKVWMFNNTEFFSTDDKTFIDSNRSLEFQTLNPDDSGVYQCCIRSVDLAYQSFVCYSTLLNVVDDIPVDEMNMTTTTEAPPPPSWNVVIEEGGTLNAQPGNNYFVKIFEDNMTDIHCLVNEVQIKIKTSNSFSSPLYNDILIASFSLIDHSGVYVCNGTMQIGNETISETMSFTVSQSWADNEHAELLDEKTVAEALKSAVAVLSCISLLLLAVFFFL